MKSEVTVAEQPCVWMCAGMLRYRLCNLDFDCEHCALNAALSGTVGALYTFDTALGTIAVALPAPHENPSARTGGS